GDYTANSGTLTFTGNDGESHPVTVDIIDDSLIEPTEGFVVDLSNLSTSLIAINTPQANGSILDNDGGAGTGISFVNDDITVNEDAGTITFNVVLAGNVAGGFTLDYATGNGSANAPGDYTANSGTLNFTGNDGESHPITVDIIDDSLIEPTEGFLVDLSGLSTDLIAINTPQANGSILDNDGGAGTGISFVNDDITVNEDAGTITFNVVLAGNVAGGFTLDYATGNGSATAPGDYTANSGTLNFTGDDGESHPIIVDIIDDSLIEPTEGFVVDLSNLSTDLIAINTPQANGSILDNDLGSGNGISFVNTDVEVTEGTGVTAVFEVTLTGSFQEAFDLSFETAFGTADGNDLVARTGNLAFDGNDGETRTITVTILDDDIIEPTEGYNIDLIGTTNPLVAINTPRANGSILDNDGGAGTGISFVNDDITVNEDAGTITFNVVLAGNVAGGFTLDYATGNGSANAPGDYTANSGTLTFTGDNGESHPVTVDIIDDSLIEPTEGFVVDLSGLSTDLIAINTPQANGSILDNDGGAGTGISFDDNDITVDEDAGTITFNVVLAGNVAGDFTLDYATGNGSANAPGDYTANSGTLNFTGDDGESHPITVDIIDDSLIEPTEGFVVDLSDLSTTLIAINTPRANGSILDNDGGAGTGISFDNDNITVDEDAGTITFNVVLAGNVPGGFTLDYATGNGSANAPGDYTANSGTLTFTGNDGESHPITVDIIDDSLIEPTEGFVVDLSNLSTDLIAINTPQANGSILDNDGGAGTGISFDNDNITVDEDAGTITFNVVLAGNVAGDFTLDYATGNGSATAPGDYTANSGTLTFTGNDGESHPVTVDIIDDDIIEPTEGFVVDLSNLSTDLIAINTPRANGSILDNDGGAGTGISFDNDNITVDEDAGTITFNVVLAGNVAGGFTLDYATGNGSANAPGDYTANSGTLTFTGDNGESHPITVDIIDDSLIEPTEGFLVDLSNLSTSLIAINTPRANGSILDNDGGAGTGISFVNDDITVNEDAGTITFNVVLAGNVAGGFTLDYATGNGSANAPGDYTANSGTLTFTGDNGESHPITVDIIDDSLIEPTEGFVVDLSDLSTTLIAINTPRANGTIIDDDIDPTLGVQFDTASIDINENAGTVSLNVVLNANVQNEFTIEFNTQEGSATDTFDYTGVPINTQTLTFGGTNPNSQNIVIPIIDDIIIEDTENFQVILSNISTSLVNILANNTTNINIIDNDGNEGYPEDITIEACETIPPAADITSTSTCAIDVTLNEEITGLDDACATEYTITRTWTIIDCVGNIREHVQVITIEDTIAPTFVEALPQNTTVACNEVPEAVILTALDSCEPNIEVVFDEVTTNDANCATGYTITRTWNSSDCAGNVISHTQIITIPPTGPITASPYEEEITILCGDIFPEVPELTFAGGCGNYDVTFTEERQDGLDSDDFIIVRTWEVTDSCENTASFEQIIFVLQPQLEEVTIDICVEAEAINLLNYLPEGFDSNGEFMILEGEITLNGNLFDPLNHQPGEYKIAYSSTGGECKYFVDFTIIVNTDCVPCGRDEIEISRTVTANGDRVNDYFEIRGVEFCQFSFDVLIFNRWGNKVAEIKDYQNDWGGESPDGAFGSSGMLPSGTYYYIIQATDTATGKKLEPFNGYIYLGVN
ncbi:Calx-beta domain-containing protein, partial [Maribacter sp. 2304DJ31-5]|uniref:Calx-beta domain-containing protein n=1 Tax=Maribacter sp. 2304DJ31-5 TaxID=3386273 RepID=UPI0039BC2680